MLAEKSKIIGFEEFTSWEVKIKSFYNISGIFRSNCKFSFVPQISLFGQ
jgi:hypothetical protein